MSPRWRDRPAACQPAGATKPPRLGPPHPRTRPKRPFLHESGPACRLARPLQQTGRAVTHRPAQGVSPRSPRFNFNFFEENGNEKTAKIIYEKYNTQNKSLELLIFEGEVLKKLSKIDENLLGNINPRTIDEIKRIYSLLNLKSTHISFETESIILNKTQKI